MCMYYVGMLPYPACQWQVKTLFQNLRLKMKNVVFLVVTVAERGFPIPNYIPVASIYLPEFGLFVAGLSFMGSSAFGLDPWFFFFRKKVVASEALNEDMDCFADFSRKNMQMVRTTTTTTTTTTKTHWKTLTILVLQVRNRNLKKKFPS